MAENAIGNEAAHFPGSISLTGGIILLSGGTNAVIGTDKSGNLYINGTQFTSGAGIGSPQIVASATTGSVSGTQTNLINYTPPSVAGTYRICATIATTAATNTGNTTCTITHTSAAGIGITHLPPFEQTGSATLLTATTAASASFSMIPYLFTIDNSGTAITATFTVSATVAEYISVTLERLV